MANVINLLKETLEVMNAHNLKIKDVDWIGSSDGSYATFDWNEFGLLANESYNNNTLTYRVAHDLVIRFRNGQWLERYHDGISGERWIVKTPPMIKKGKVKNIKSLFGNDNDLETIHMKLKQGTKSK
jgi:hypothetical protein